MSTKERSTARSVHLKCCTACGQEKPIERFHRDNSLKAGRKSRCAACCTKSVATFNKRTRKSRTAYQRLYRDVHRERLNKLINTRRRTLPSVRIRHMLSAAKLRAAKKKIPFNISDEWVMTAAAQTQCAVTGAMFDLMPYDGGARKNPLAPSIDRIDPTQGYTDDNCRLVCVWYNIAKQDWSDDLMRTILAAALPRIVQ